MAFIVNNKWNPKADFSKLDLPYSVAVGDSIIAVTMAHKSDRLSRIQAASFILDMGFDSTVLMYRGHLECIICSNRAILRHAKSYTRLIINMCDSCLNEVNKIWITMRELRSITEDVHLLSHDTNTFLKKKYRWDDPDIPSMYIADTVSAVVNAHYPIWLIVRELSLLSDVTRYIMIYYALSYLWMIFFCKYISTSTKSGLIVQCLTLQVPDQVRYRTDPLDLRANLNIGIRYIPFRSTNVYNIRVAGGYFSTNGDCFVE